MDFKILKTKKGENIMKLNMKKNYSKQNGITLIALVVTIVVLLILAGVSVNALFGNSGIIEKAKEAQNRMDKATENDQKSIDELTNWINNQVNGTTSGEFDNAQTISFTVDGTTYQAKEGMTWKQAFEAGYFDNKEQTDSWYEMYGTAEKQKKEGGGSKYLYCTHKSATDEYSVTDAKAYNIMLCNNRLYNGGTQYFKADGSLYDYFGSVFLYIIPEGATQSSSSQVMPDDVITTNGKYVIYNDM